MLVLLAAGVQVWCVGHAIVPALDCVRFAERARVIEQLGVTTALAGDTEQPLFPAAIATVHQASQSLTPGGLNWATTAQLIAAMCLTLCVVPLYLVTRSALGRWPALVGTAAFCLLPEVARLGADGTSDALHLLLFTTALWTAYQTLATSRVGWGVATGMLVALAALTRAEALALLPATVLALMVTRRPWQSWGDTRRAVFVTGAVASGLALVLAPFCYAAGVSGTHDVVDRMLGRPTRETNVAAVHKTGSAAALATGTLGDANGEPLVFASREPAPSSRRRGIVAGTTTVMSKLAEAFHYLAGALVLLGMIEALRRCASDRERTWLALVVCLAMCYLAAVWVLATREGYLSARHLVPLVPATIGWLLAGSEAVAGRLARGSATHSSRVKMTAAVVAVALLCCVPQTVASLHASRLAHRQASDWLAQQAAVDGNADGGTVLDTRGWTGLYTGRTTYAYSDAAVAFADPALEYVVVERREVESTSDRADTLRRLLDLAAQPMKTFEADGARPAGHVIVYRWHPQRLAAAFATPDATSSTR